MTNGELVLAAMAGVVVVAWLAHAALFPYVRCVLCKGRGQVGGGGRTFRVCPACRGVRRLRLGARIARPDLRRTK